MSMEPVHTFDSSTVAAWSHPSRSKAHLSKHTCERRVGGLARKHRYNFLLRQIESRVCDSCYGYKLPGWRTYTGSSRWSRYNMVCPECTSGGTFFCSNDTLRAALVFSKPTANDKRSHQGGINLGCSCDFCRQSGSARSTTLSSSSQITHDNLNMVSDLS
jgi:hypothetical protein